MNVLVLSLFFAMAAPGALGMGPAKKMGNSPRAMQAFVREGASAAISSYREKKAAGEALEEKKAHDEAQPDEEAAAAAAALAEECAATEPNKCETPCVFVWTSPNRGDCKAVATADEAALSQKILARGAANLKRKEQRKAAAEALEEKNALDETQPDEEAAVALPVPEVAADAQAGVPLAEAGQDQPSASTADNTFRADVERLERQAAAAEALGLSPDEAAVKALALAKATEAAWKKIRAEAAEGEQEIESIKEHIAATTARTMIALGEDVAHFGSPGEADAFRRALSGKPKTKAGEMPPSTASAASVESPQDQQRKIASLRVRAKQPNDIEVGVKTAPAPDALAPAADALAPASDVPGAEPAADAPATTSDAAQECSATEQNKCKTPCAWVWSSLKVGVCKDFATADEAAKSDEVEVRRARGLKKKEQRKAQQAADAEANALAPAQPAASAPPTKDPFAEEKPKSSSIRAVPLMAMLAIAAIVV